MVPSRFDDFFDETYDTFIATQISAKLRLENFNSFSKTSKWEYFLKYSEFLNLPRMGNSVPFDVQYSHLGRFVVLY